MQPNTTLPADMVLVEQVLDRDFKDDCRGHTGITWDGKGSVRAYPRALWPKLAGHPDVWRLVDATKTAGQVEADQAAKEEADRVERENERKGQNIDSETVTLPDTDADTIESTDGSEAAASVDERALPTTEAELEAWTDDDIRAYAASHALGLHPRLNPINLRARFLDASQQLLAAAKDQPQGE